MYVQKLVVLLGGESTSYSSELPLAVKALKCGNSKVEVWVSSSILGHYSFAKNNFFLTFQTKSYILTGKFPTLLSFCLFSKKIVGKKIFRREYLFIRSKPDHFLFISGKNELTLSG